MRTDDGQLFSCRVKGSFRIKGGLKSTNPVAVGDRVAIEPLDQSTALITELLDRKNYIIRRSTNLSKRCHIIAANVDVALLLVTIAHPETSTTFIDRFLATAEAYGIPTIMVFNKVELYGESELQAMHQLTALYTAMGYECHHISALEGRLGTLPEALSGRTALLSGNSGVGKSTLLNALCPQAMARTAVISEAHDTGQHTTTLSEMHMLPAGGALIDTPGIKGFGAYDMKPEEISHYFRDIFHLSADCRFGNCSHTREPHCAVRQALEEGRLAQSRYQSYISMRTEGDEPYR